MGNCFNIPTEIKNTDNKSIQCDMELTITEESIEKIERNIDEMLEEDYHYDIMNFIEELIEKNNKIDN